MLDSFLTGVMALATLGNPQPVTEPKVVGVSVFTNNFAVVLRELPVDATGMVRFTEIPDARLGTFWVGARGTQVLEAIRSIEEIEGEPQLLGDWGSLLQRNVGKTATLVFNQPGMRSVTGTVVGVSGGAVYIQVRGSVHSYLMNQLRSIQLPGSDANIKSTRRSDQAVVTIRTSGAGTVYVMAIERGMSWAPSYRIDISDPKRLNIVGQSALTNDLASFENVAVKLVSGFPSLRFLNQLDPFTISMQPIMQRSGGIGGGGGPGAAPPAARRDATDAVFAEGFAAPGGEGEQIGDIFFYTLRQVTLKKDERGLFIFLNTTADYKQLFTMAVPNFISPQGSFFMDRTPLETFRSIVFKNDTGEPWTNAPVLVTSDNNVLGQTELSYTGPSAEAKVEFSMTPDIQGEAAEVEVARRVGAIKNQSGARLYDQVTMQGTITLQNRLGETADMRVTKTTTGLATSASDNGQITTRPSGVSNINNHSTIVWELGVAPGQKKELTYRYDVYVTSR